MAPPHQYDEVITSSGKGPGEASLNTTHSFYLPAYRLKALSSALAFSVRTAPPVRLSSLRPSFPFLHLLPRCCLLGPAIAVPSLTKYPSTLQTMREPQFATARTARHVHRSLPPSHMRLHLSIPPVITHSNAAEIHRLQLWHYVQDPKVGLQGQVWRRTHQST
jgi:hypothetical protein